MRYDTPVPTRPTDHPRELQPGMRALLWVAGVLVLLAGVQLLFFTERTATHFAWTIQPPLTAATLRTQRTATHVDER